MNLNNLTQKLFLALATTSFIMGCGDLESISRANRDHTEEPVQDFTTYQICFAPEPDYIIATPTIITTPTNIQSEPGEKTEASIAEELYNDRAVENGLRSGLDAFAKDLGLPLTPGSGEESDRAQNNAGTSTEHTHPLVLFLIQNAAHAFLDIRRDFKPNLYIYLPYVSNGRPETKMTIGIGGSMHVFYQGNEDTALFGGADEARQYALKYGYKIVEYLLCAKHLDQWFNQLPESLPSNRPNQLRSKEAVLQQIREKFAVDPTRLEDSRDLGSI